MKTRIRVYDLDGTLIDSSHRYKLGGNGKIDLQHWRDNSTPEQIRRDKLLPHAVQYKADLSRNDTIVIIATARVLSDADDVYIRDVLGTPAAVISRNGDNDTRGGAELKIKGLARLFNLRGFSKIRDIVFFEDNAAYLKTVCDHFKGLGMIGVYVPSEQGH